MKFADQAVPGNTKVMASAPDRGLTALTLVMVSGEGNIKVV